MPHQSSDLTTQQVIVGANNLAGGQSPTTDERRALYLKLFSGEMFKGFQHNAIARDMVMKRTLKTAVIAVHLYRSYTAEYHTPGNAILGTPMVRPQWQRRPSRLTTC